jgi:hypothetical protein
MRVARAANPPDQLPRKLRGGDQRGRGLSVTAASSYQHEVRHDRADRHDESALPGTQLPRSIK